MNHNVKILKYVPSTILLLLFAILPCKTLEWEIVVPNFMSIPLFYCFNCKIFETDHHRIVLNIGNMHTNSGISKICLGLEVR